MVVPKINSVHGSDTRNVINRAIDVLNQQGKAIQDLVADGQLTEQEYANLLRTINGLVKKGEIRKSDLSEDFIKELGKIEIVEESIATLEDDISLKLSEKVSKGESGAVTWSMASQGFRENVTGGNTAIVGIDSVNEVNISNGAVTTRKTDFMQHSTNLFNHNTITEGYRIGSDGTMEADSSYSVTGFIPVERFADYTLYGLTHFARYNKDKEFVGRTFFEYTQTHTYAMPEDTYFIRINIQGRAVGQRERQLNKGSELLPFELWYSPKLIDVAATELDVEIKNKDIGDDQVDVDKVEFMYKSSNLFNIESCVIRHSIDLTTGELTPRISYTTSDFIKVKPDTQYSFYGLRVLAQYDENRSFLSHGYIVYEGETVNLRSDARYIRVAFQPASSFSGRRINEGSELMPFEEYYNHFKDDFELQGLNEVIENHRDRYMIDVPFEGVFNTDEIYDDYSNFSNVKHEEVYGMFDELMVSYPDYIAKETLGLDDFGNEINLYSFKPAFSSVEYDTKVPTIAINCGLHGIEHATSLATYLFLKQMCEKWQDDQILEALRFNVNFLIIPVSNPSGWDDYTRTTRNGVDLNRNFPYDWAYGGEGTSTYSGESPGSETETQILMKFVDDYPEIDAFYDFHNFHRGSNGDYFMWIPRANKYVQHMSQNLFGRLTRKWRNDFDFIPDDYFVGYSTVESQGYMSAYANSKGVKLSSAFEICNVWVLDPGTAGNTGHYNQDVCKAGVEALGNWMTINLREIIG